MTLFRQKYAFIQRIWNHERCLSIIRGRRCNRQKTVCTGTERPRKPKIKKIINNKHVLFWQVPARLVVTHILCQTYFM